MSLRSFFRRGPIAGASISGRLGEPLQNLDREGDRRADVGREIGALHQEPLQPPRMAGAERRVGQARSGADLGVVGHGRSLAEGGPPAQSESKGGSQ